MFLLGEQPLLFNKERNNDDRLLPTNNRVLRIRIGDGDCLCEQEDAVKSTEGLKMGDKLYYYNVVGGRHIEVVVSVLDKDHVITEGYGKRHIRMFRGRIKPKAPRLEKWILVDKTGCGTAIYSHPADAISGVSLHPGTRVVHMREVRKAKK